MDKRLRYLHKVDRYLTCTLLSWKHSGDSMFPPMAGHFVT